MRVVVTKLMDKGLKRPSRGMPVPGDLRHEVGDGGRRALLLCSVEKSEIPVIARLLHPQIADVGDRCMTARGYELDKASGQLFGQAWEIEPVRR